ncbi:MAG TPA: lytic transglycosylase domain-containing protein [Acidimicrobiales bacterium]|nr:lytic transglycosylase domain-containing protein [Acidimicrobiales bacterium]
MRRRRGAAAAVLVAALLAGCAAEPGRAGDAGAAAPRPTGPPRSSTTTGAPGEPALPDRDTRPVAAGDPAGLAAQLATAARAIADAGSSGEELGRAGHLQQVAVAALAARPDWDGAVAAALPAGTRDAVALDVGAVRELAALVRRPRATLPAWRIRPPPAPEVLRRHYAEGEAATGVPWTLLAAVHLVETRMSRIEGDSSAGAQGPMQFLPSTWSAYGEGDIHDTRDAILGAARFLAASGAPEDPYQALLRYNPTPRYARSVAAFAARMAADERAFLGYHGWEVHYRTTLGDVWLRPGYDAEAERPVTGNDLG